MCCSVFLQQKDLRVCLDKKNLVAINATDHEILTVKTSGHQGAPASAGPCLEAGGAEEGPIRCGSCMKG